MIVYIDTSAALQLVIEEKESQRLAETLQAHLDTGSQLVSSFLLPTEMHCGADRSRCSAQVECVGTAGKGTA